MATHPRLVWPRSDGNEDLHPQQETPTAKGRWYEPVELGDWRYTPFEEAAGAHLATILGLPNLPGRLSPRDGLTGDGECHRIPMPSGYKIFITKRPPGDSRRSGHSYCYGCGAHRFRASEWKIHAAWLFDTTKALANHDRECGCKTTNANAIPSSSKPVVEIPHPLPRVKVPPGPLLPKASPRKLPPAQPIRHYTMTPAGSGSEPPRRCPTFKRTDSDSARPAKRPRESSEPEEEREAPESARPEATGVAYERGLDLKTQRRFRLGELVWARVHLPTQAPLPEITHWPMMIADIRLKVAVAPPTEEDGEVIPGDSITHSWAYHLRPLGMFSPKHDVVRDAKDLLPWAMGDELLGGQAGWLALAKEGTRVLKEGIAAGSGSAEERWNARWGKKVIFEEMGGDAVYRLSVAVRTASQIAQCWCQTNRIYILPQTILSDVDRILDGSDMIQFFQGLWLGGERIWVDDIVRLEKSRAEMPFHLSEIDVPAAQARAAFMKIRAIAMVKNQWGAWQCHLYGDVGELVPAGREDVRAWTDDGITIPLQRDYRVPHGFRFHQLNAAGFEAKCDISATQNWLHEAGRPREGRHAPTRVAMALKGRSPGSVAHSAPGTWMEDLFANVDKSCGDVEKSLKEYYIQESDRAPGPLQPIRQAPPPPPPAAPITRKAETQGIAVLRPITIPNNALPIMTKHLARKPASITSVTFPGQAVKKAVPPVLAPAAAVAASAPPLAVLGLSKLWQGSSSHIVYDLADSSPEPNEEQLGI